MERNDKRRIGIGLKFKILLMFFICPLSYGLYLIILGMPTWYVLVPITLFDCLSAWS